jgi:4-oxalocrotonate tautomerase
MPYIQVQMLEDGTTEEQKAAVIEGITQVFVDVLNRRPEGVWVVLNEVPLANWGIGGETVATRRMRASS